MAKKTGCKLIHLGKGRGIRHGCYNGRTGRFEFVSAATYRRRKGLSGTVTKRRKTTKRRKRR